MLVCSGFESIYVMQCLRCVLNHHKRDTPYRNCPTRQIRESLPVVLSGEKALNKDSQLSTRARVSRRDTDAQVPGSVQQEGGKRRRKKECIVVRRSDATWATSWESSQIISLADLDLPDLAIEAFPGDGRERTDNVEVNLAVQKLGLGFYVTASVHAQILQHCNRCGLPFAHKVDADFETCLVATNDNLLQLQDGIRVEDDSTLIPFEPGDAEIDLTSLVRDAIVLSQADEMLCSQACKDLGAQRWEYDSPSDFSTTNAAWLPLIQAKQSYKSQ